MTLTSHGKVLTRSIHPRVQEIQAFKNFKTLNKNFNILSNADADANADAVVTAIALPVLSYRRAKKVDLIFRS